MDKQMRWEVFICRFRLGIQHLCPEHPMQMSANFLRSGSAPGSCQSPRWTSCAPLLGHWLAAGPAAAPLLGGPVQSGPPLLQQGPAAPWAALHSRLEGPSLAGAQAPAGTDFCLSYALPHATYIPAESGKGQSGIALLRILVIAVQHSSCCRH